MGEHRNLHLIVIILLHNCPKVKIVINYHWIHYNYTVALIIMIIIIITIFPIELICR